jgi:tetratricopeptide (TPR) repeat protein
MKLPFINTGRDDFMLTPQELRHRANKRRRFLLIAGSALLLLIIAALVARPVRNAVLSWQARRHAARAFVFIDQEKWREARDEASTAYHLRTSEPAAVRAVAKLLSRAGQVDALEFWKSLEAVTPLTADDLREKATVALKADDLSTAAEAVQRLLQNSKVKPAAADWLLAADIWSRKRESDKTAEFAQKVVADPKAKPREQLRAVLILENLIRTGSVALVQDPKQIDQRLAALASGNDDVALDALGALGQFALIPSADAPDARPMPIEEIVRRLDNHPLAGSGHKLLAADLEMAQQPDQRGQIEQREIDRWKNGNDDELTALGAWLYQHGEFQKTLDAIPLQRAVLNRELFLQHVNALGALGRWDEIRKLLESERYPLDPVIQNMYLARCYAQQGQQLGADNNWQRAIQNAAGDLNRLLLLADYAEKNSNLKIAGTAYDAAAAIAPKSRAAELGRLRVAQASGDTMRIHEVLQQLLVIWPNDTALQNDEAYTRLLLLPADTKPDAPELKAIETLARKLVDQEPSSLPHRTVLGLVLLKENQPYSALAVYSGLNVPQRELTPSAVVVHSAVLAATGRDADAHTEIAHLPQNKILPEERALINSL